MAEQTARERWEPTIRDFLVGRKITGVRYQTQEEAEGLGWYSRALVITLDDGAQLIPSADDEGNNAGAIFTNYKDLQTIPVI